MRHSSNGNKQPPKLFLRFFRWYCHPKLMNHIEGDLVELYRERVRDIKKRKADTKFIFDVLFLFRPGIIRPIAIYRNLNTYGMYKSYFRIGWRNLLSNKGYSLINIGGLALGMMVTLLIGLWVYDELSFNRYHKNYDHVAQVLSHVAIDGQTTTYSALPMPVSSELRTNYGNDFNKIASTWSGERLISYKENVFTKRGYFAESEFPEIISLEMLHGTEADLKDPSSILLSQSLATAMFGDAEPLNREVMLNNSIPLRVAGVYRDLPRNSTFYGATYMAPIGLLFSNNEAMDNWRSSSFHVYVQLSPNSTVDGASAKIEDVMYAHTQSPTRPRLILNPMKRWHLYEFSNGENVGGRIRLVSMIGIIGVFILALACINFVNLSTARSEKRAKEVGIRKAIGSIRGQLIRQFICESFLVASIASLLAVGLVVVLLPWFNNFSSKEIDIPWSNPLLWPGLFVFVLLISLLAGSYPAFYLSSFQPARVLKGSVNSGRSASVPRRILVVGQFAVSVILIAGTFVVYSQIQFVKDRPSGYAKEGLISVPLMTSEIRDRYEALKLELLKTNLITNVSLSSSPTTDIWSSADNLDWEGKDPDRQFLFGTICVDTGFGDVVSWKIKEGRDFSPEIATDTMAFIFNQAAIEQMGLSDPIGKVVRWHDKSWNIIGITHDMVMTSPFGSARPTVFMIDFRERPFNVINIRLNSGLPVAAALQGVERIFKRIVPSTPFDYRFADLEYAAKFELEENIGKLALLFTLLAILISCMGLLGLASFVAEHRTKEIGIRKVLGASAAQVWLLISSEFVALVSVACLVAVPVSYYLMSNWLTQYDYRIELDWQLFVGAALSAIVIALATVSYRSARAAFANPARSLRSE